jgi:hypothetical protein
LNRRSDDALVEVEGFTGRSRPSIEAIAQLILDRDLNPRCKPKTRSETVSGFGVSDGVVEKRLAKPDEGTDKRRPAVPIRTY